MAVKVFEGVQLDQADPRLIRELRTEAQMMENLSHHPNIVKFIGAVTQGANCHSCWSLGQVADSPLSSLDKLPHLITALH